jgi:hypothetical protein
MVGVTGSIPVAPTIAAGLFAAAGLRPLKWPKWPSKYQQIQYDIYSH